MYLPPGNLTEGNPLIPVAAKVGSKVELAVAFKDGLAIFCHVVSVAPLATPVIRLASKTIVAPTAFIVK
jgi:hypothetical protein